MNNELYHYGVLGMKWGVRRYQNKDGSLTNVGRKRYDVDIEGARKKLETAKQNSKADTKEYYRKTAYGMLYNEDSAKNLNNANRKLNWAKEDFQTEKIKQKLNSETKSKSNHRLDLERHYLDKGMNREEAEIAAYKRAKTEKILAASAGIAITAAAAYVAYKHYDNTVDKIIKYGTSLQNISTDANKGVSDAFYAAFTKSDKSKYKGLYGKQLSNYGFNKVYDTTIGVNNNLKISSQKSAISNLSELVKNDSEYKRALERHLEQTSGALLSSKQQKVVTKGLNTLKNGKVDSNVYKALNVSLSNHRTDTADNVMKGFYNKLKTSGYDAIMDINDKSYSGYKSKKPVIVFNGGSKITIDKIRELGEEEINKNYSKSIAKVYLRTMSSETVKQGSIAAAVILGMKTNNSRTNDRIVREYKKQHPNTKLSYKEIIRNYSDNI